MTKKIVFYNHHGREVAVFEEAKGKHWEANLCGHCEFYKPNTPENCKIAQSTYEACIENHTCTPIWECAKFEFEK